MVHFTRMVYPLGQSCQGKCNHYIIVLCVAANRSFWWRGITQERAESSVEGELEPTFLFLITSITWPSRKRKTQAYTQLTGDETELIRNCIVQNCPSPNHMIMTSVEPKIWHQKPFQHGELWIHKWWEVVYSFDRKLGHFIPIPFCEKRIEWCCENGEDQLYSVCIEENRVNSL